MSEAVKRTMEESLNENGKDNHTDVAKRPKMDGEASGLIANPEKENTSATVPFQLPSLPIAPPSSNFGILPVLPINFAKEGDDHINNSQNAATITTEQNNNSLDEKSTTSSSTATTVTTTVTTTAIPSSSPSPSLLPTFTAVPSASTPSSISTPSPTPPVIPSASTSAIIPSSTPLLPPSSPSIPSASPNISPSVPSGLSPNVPVSSATIPSVPIPSIPSPSIPAVPSPVSTTATTATSSSSSSSSVAPTPPAAGISIPAVVPSFPSSQTTPSIPPNPQSSGISIPPPQPIQAPAPAQQSTIPAVPAAVPHTPQTHNHTTTPAPSAQPLQHTTTSETSTPVVTGPPYPLTNQLQFCDTGILKIIWKHPECWPFYKPVDAVALRLPDYHSIIKNPMDLGTVKKRLAERYYQFAHQCIEDMKLTFYNCRLYNKAGSDVIRMCDNVYALFEDRLRLMPQECVILPPKAPRQSTAKKGKRSAVGRRRTETTTSHLPKASPRVPVIAKPLPVPETPITRRTSMTTHVGSNANVNVAGGTPLSHGGEPVWTPGQPVFEAPNTRRKSVTAEDFPPSQPPDSVSQVKEKTVPKRSIARVNSTSAPIAKSASSTGAGGKKKKGRVSTQLQFCRKVLQKLFAKKHKDFAYIFYYPVDPVILNLPDYHTIIKKPMDLTTIKQKLDSKEYKRSSEFADDVNLVFRNCRRYNPPDSDVYQMCRKLQDVFEAAYAHLPEEESEDEEEVEAVEEEESSEEEEEEEEGDGELQQEILAMKKVLENIQKQLPGKTKPPVKRRASVAKDSGTGRKSVTKKATASTSRKSVGGGARKSVTAASKPKPAPKKRPAKTPAVGRAPIRKKKKMTPEDDCSPMTIFEQRQLGKDIQCLTQEEGIPVYEIIKDRIPSLVDSNSKEVRIDIASLDPILLRHVDRYVKGVLERRKNNTAKTTNSSSSSNSINNSSNNNNKPKTSDAQRMRGGGHSSSESSSSSGSSSSDLSDSSSSDDSEDEEFDDPAPAPAPAPAVRKTVASPRPQQQQQQQQQSSVPAAVPSLKTEPVKAPTMNTAQIPAAVAPVSKSPRSVAKSPPSTIAKSPVQSGNNNNASSSIDLVPSGNAFSPLNGGSSSSLTASPMYMSPSGKEASAASLLKKREPESIQLPSNMNLKKEVTVSNASAWGNLASMEGGSKTPRATSPNPHDDALEAYRSKALEQHQKAEELRKREERENAEKLNFENARRQQEEEQRKKLEEQRLIEEKERVEKEAKEKASRDSDKQRRREEERRRRLGDMERPEHANFHDLDLADVFGDT